MRSLTDADGLKLSSLAIISGYQLKYFLFRFNLTNGVFPTREVISFAISMK